MDYYPQIIKCKNMKKNLLSLYHYERKHEDQKFFDAWWQFIYRLEFFCLLLFLALVYFTFLILKVEIDIRIALSLFPVTGGILLLISYLFNSYRETNFYSFITSNYEKVNPFSKWLYFSIEMIIIFLFVLSLGSYIEFIS